MKTLLLAIIIISSITFLQAQENNKLSVAQLKELQLKAAEDGNYALAGNYKKAVQLKKDINLAVEAEDYAQAEKLKQELNALALNSTSNKSSNSNLKLEDVCPGDLAQEYKTKMINAGSNTEASGAYGGIAAYYAYKCECEFGTERGANLLDMMNGLVRTNETYYKNKYGTIETVSSCKNLTGGSVSADNSSNGTSQQNNANSNYLSESIKNQNIQNANKIAQQLGLDANQTKTLNIIASSGNIEEMNKRLQEHNINQISDLTAQGLNQMLGDNNSLPINSDDISRMLNGDFEGALEDMNRNLQVNNLAKDMNGNTALAGATYDLMNESADVISEAIVEGQYERAKEFIKLVETYEIKSSYNSILTNTFNYTSNFNDKNWKLSTNEFINLETINENEIKVEIKEKFNKKDLQKNDFAFLIFENVDFDLKNDFSITFDYGVPQEQNLLDLDGKIKNYLPGFISLFISNTNKVSFNSTGVIHAINSFTPSLNQYYKGFANDNSKLIRLDDINKELYDRIYEIKRMELQTGLSEEQLDSITNYVNEKMSGMSPRQMLKYSKELLAEDKERMEEANKINQVLNSKGQAELYYKIKIKKQGPILYISSLSLSGTPIGTIKFDYKYTDQNKIYFGLGSMNESMGFCNEGDYFIIKNFSIKQ